MHRTIVLTCAPARIDSSRIDELGGPIGLEEGKKSEAVAARVPVLATRIDGSIGLLGRDYPGYFPVGDTEALARLLNRIETDAAFLERLQRAIARRAHLFRPAREKATWKKLIDETLAKSPSPQRQNRRADRLGSDRLQRT